MRKKAIATTKVVDDSTAVQDHRTTKRRMKAVLLATLGMKAVLLATLAAVAVLAAVGHGQPQRGPASELAGAKRGIASGTNETLAGSKPGVSPGSGTGSVLLAGRKPGISPGSGPGSVLLAGSKPGVSPGTGIVP